MPPHPDAKTAALPTFLCCRNTRALVFAGPAVAGAAGPDARMAIATSLGGADGASAPPPHPPLQRSPESDEPAAKRRRLQRVTAASSAASSDAPSSDAPDVTAAGGGAQRQRRDLAAPAPAPIAAEWALADSGLSAALQAVGVAGRLAGVACDDSCNHGADPWRSVIRKRMDGLELKVGRHASEAEATKRVLEASQVHPAYVTAGRFMLGQHVYVDAATMERLVELAGRAAADAAGGGGSSGCSTPP